MRTANISIFRPARANNRRSRHFIARHPAFWLMLMILGAAVVSSVMVGARGPSRKNTAGRGQNPNTNSVANVLSQKRNTRPRGNSTSSIGGAEPTSLEAALFVDPPATATRSSVAPTSLSTPGERSNNSNAANQQPSQAGSLQGDRQAENRSQDDKGLRKPREERLTKAHSFDGDLRNLSRRRPVPRERNEPEEPEPHPVFAPGTFETAPSGPSLPAIGGPSAPAPAPIAVYEGLDRFNWGAGSP